ncbi:DUF2213 domain-containing protein [Floridanema evergladense]|uniref:DUF2213 domain-containing protein n=1 Tax=Floridaenema evergladense BLCC-F167 TaxID=3153639 RepID=A0ABV4WCY8_9CYAN
MVVVFALNLSMPYRIDAGTIQKKPYKSKQGHLRAEALATRAGVFPYLNSDGSIRHELRHPDDVFNPKSLATLGGVPVTLGHPKERVTPTNFPQLGKGTVGDSVEAVNPYVKVILNVQAQDAIDAIEKRTHKEVSLVYATDVVEDSGIWEGQPYTHRQIGILHEDGERYIDYRELALVERGRAGSTCGVHLDGLEDIAVQVKEDAKEANNMATLHLDSMSVEVDASVAPIINAHITKQDAALAEVQAQFKQKSAQFQTLLSALQKAGFENADDVATAMKALKAEVERSKGEIIAAQEETKQAKSEADQAKEQLGAMKETVAKKDAADIASKIVPSEVKLDFDSLDSLGIKKAVISHKYPDIKLDGLSDEAIEGMWTVAVRTDSTAPLREAAIKATETKTDTKEDAAMSARDMMSQRRMKKKQAMQAMGG